MSQVTSGIFPQCRGEALVRQPGSQKITGSPLHPQPKVANDHPGLSDRRLVQAGSLGKLNVERRSQSLDMVDERKRREEEGEQVFHL